MEPLGIAAVGNDAMTVINVVDFHHLFLAGFYRRTM
jgi:hypothetical protein